MVIRSTGIHVYYLGRIMKISNALHSYFTGNLKAGVIECINWNICRQMGLLYGKNQQIGMIVFGIWILTGIVACGFLIDGIKFINIRIMYITKLMFLGNVVLSKYGGSQYFELTYDTLTPLLVVPGIHTHTHIYY